MYGFQQKKILRHAKRQKAQPEEIKQASKSDSDMAENLELFYHKFKITMINRLRAIIKKSRQIM